MSEFDVAPPAFSDDALRDMAARLYGIDGAVKTLDSERDQNARVTDTTGASYTLKIANAAEPIASIELPAAAASCFSTKRRWLACCAIPILSPLSMRGSTRVCAI